MGKGYVIDFCIAFTKKEKENERYRNYVTDALRIITENTAKEVGGSYLTSRFAIEKENKSRKNAQDEAKETINRISAKLANMGA